MYDDFENRKMGRFDARVSRYIASWHNMGGKFYADEFFKDWLRSEGLTEREVDHVYWMATCGKMELENSAKPFIEAQKKYIESFDDEPD